MPEGTASSQKILKFGGVFDLGSRPRCFLKAIVVLTFNKVETVAELRSRNHVAFQRLALAVKANVPGIVVYRLDDCIMVLTETLFEYTEPLPAVEPGNELPFLVET